MQLEIAAESGERFTLVDVQCLGACGEGPVVQINNDYYTELTVERLDALLDRFE